MKSTVSVIIPVFNKADWIEETLISVANQSFQDWECIIIDDGSTDESLKVIEAFIRKTPGVWRVIRQKNQGQCVARNKGIEESSGEYVAFLDGDDCWAENKLEVQVNILDKNPRAALVICPYRIYKEGEGKGRFVCHGDSKSMLRNWINLRGFGAGTESTGLVRKKFLLSIGGFDRKLSTSAGLDLTLRLSHCGEILNAKNTFMKYRIHTGQWHSNLEILEADLSLLRQKIPRTESLRGGNLSKKHRAYLLLHKLRQGFSLPKLLGSSSDIRLDYYLSILVLCIIRRNLVGKARATFPVLLTRIPKKLYGDLFSQAI